MSNKPQAIVGVDREELGEIYEAVLSSVLRADPDQIVICTNCPTDADFAMAQRAFLSGHCVLLVERRHQAPDSTKWLNMRIA